MENKELVKENEKEVATLGDGQVFIKRTPHGAIKSICAKLKLEETKGELANIQGNISITAAGYNTLNKIASISIFTPEKLTLPDGSVVVNPFPVFDKESGSIEKVWVRKTAIGYAPSGNLVITSTTLLYDIKLYFIQDLIKKIKKNKAVGRITVESLLTEEEKGKGIFIPTQGKIGVYANLENIDALTCFETFVQNKLFGDRKAQTVAERNVLKKHPALAFSKVQATGQEKRHEVYIQVIGWNNDLTQKDYMKLATMYENGENISDYKGINVEGYEVSGDISDEDLKASADEEEINNEEENTIVHELTEKTAEPVQQIIIDTEKDKVKVPVGNENNLFDNNGKIKIEDLGDDPF
ncbi:hypothetical protein [Clostridium felsineum]|uniref:hypothetical protein n=1 Tax=Clostridium felsineum TaxID=36839 RepID=UPI00098C2241|nr:hypothetical protein [Clostridium felsineum]URZ15470.1 hypothetical protein CLFE_015100 [Clostridium felsineum DSM 794]